MPWRECHIMDERLRFVARLLGGERMTALCVEFGISRKTSYKVFDRYKDYGVHGLTARSRRPYRHANQLPLVLETQIVRLKKDFPDWGLRRSARSYGAAVGRGGARRSAPSMQSWIGTVWFSGAGVGGAG